MNDNDSATLTSFERSSTLSSSTSLNLGRSHRHPFLTNPSMSLTSHSEDSTQAKSLRNDMSQFQQIDEIFEELASPRHSSKATHNSSSKGKSALDLSLDGSSSSENEEKVTSSPRKSRLSLGQKSVSWIPRNTSPLPPTNPEAAVSSNPPNPNDTLPTKKMTRCRSEIISLVDGNAPPLPYNIKSKKRVARRIQSIHHIVEHSDNDVTSNLHSLSIQTDDDVTTISGGSGSATDSQRRPSLASSDAGDVSLQSVSVSATSVRSRVKYVPYRLQEKAPDLTSRISRPLSVREQTRIATLLSAQEAQFGFNMFDALIPGDNDEISRLTQLGYHYEDAALMIFEKRYVTTSNEPLSAYYPPRGSPHSHSAPTSPNISYDYSISPNASDAPNYSADYAYARGGYYPQANFRQHPSFSGASSVSSGYMSGYASPMPSPPALTPGYYASGYPIAYSPVSYATSYASPVSAPPPPPTHVSAGLPPKSPKNTRVTSSAGVGVRFQSNTTSGNSGNTSSNSSGNSQSVHLSSSSSSSSKRSSSSKPVMGTKHPYGVPTHARLVQHNS